MLECAIDANPWVNKRGVIRFPKAHSTIWEHCELGDVDCLAEIDAYIHNGEFGQIVRSIVIDVIQDSILVGSGTIVH